MKEERNFLLLLLLLFLFLLLLLLLLRVRCLQVVIALNHNPVTVL